MEAQRFSALIATPLYPFATTFLREHGCLIKTVTRGGVLMALVQFPLGTTKELRNLAASTHYRVTLPDGITIRQTYDPMTECSTLSLPAQERWDENILIPPEP